ncbi:unnamed protein product [Lactuca virosa]|uniref:Uncharacterized protein n=1 Tax=Lactuca virosa TaxID=75947 RepID=A0AAU9MNA9_9ASTR|nr:unnamed protein product [Lactuca virosa]
MTPNLIASDSNRATATTCVVCILCNHRRRYTSSLLNFSFITIHEDVDNSMIHASIRLFDRVLNCCNSVFVE